MLNQSFTWDDRVWEVDDVIARTQQKPVERLPVLDLFDAVFMSGDTTDLTDEPVGSYEFRIRCHRANLRWPILVVRDDDGIPSVVDGYHRLWKAWSRGSKTILARVLTRAELYAIPHAIPNFPLISL